MTPLAATPTATVTPSASQPGTVLYSMSSWSSGLNGWAGTADWKSVDGMLVNDGTNNDGTKWIIAPYAPGNINNYAVEAEIQWVRDIGAGSSFGIVARATQGDSQHGAYWGGYQPRCCPNPIAFVGATDNAWALFTYASPGAAGSSFVAAKPFQPGTSWHTFRLEVQGNTIRLTIDHDLVLAGTDNQFLSGGQVGLWSMFSQINVRSFKVIKL